MSQVVVPEEVSRRRATAGAAAARLRHLLGPVVLILLVAGFGSLYPTTFLSSTNIVDNILGQMAVIAIVASAQTVAMVVGEFDLSVSGIAALAMVTCAVIVNTAELDGTPKQAGSVVLAIALGLLAGVLAGAFNGLLVSYLGVLAFIATLGSTVVFTNLARFRVQGQPVFGLVEPGFVDVARAKPAGIPATVLFAAAFAVAVWFLLDHTTAGRRMYAVGGNAEVARLSGIDVRRVRFAAFVISGFGAAVAGILQSAYNATADTGATDSWMLTSIAAVFLGMAMFRGGRPNLAGTLLGVLLLRVLDNGLTFTSLDSYVQSIISGLAVILAVLPPAIARVRARR